MKSLGLNGLMVALTTPFRDGNLDLVALEQHISALLPYVSGFVLGGTTGESASLSDDELIALLKASRAAVAHKLLLVGFWRATAQESLASAKKLAAFADAILVPIPKELVHKDEHKIEAFYDHLAQSIDSPIVLYNFPARCEGHALHVDLVARLASKYNHVIGVKDSSEEADLAKNIIIGNLPLQAILGNDRFLADILALAQQQRFKYPVASISGASSVPRIAQIEADIYRLFNAGDHVMAQVKQQSLIADFFNDWSQYAAKLGGQAPILKNLISLELANYPIDVRPPLKDFKSIS